MAKLGLRDHKYDEFSAATAMELLKMEVEMSSRSPNKTVSLLRKSSSFEKNSSTLLKKKTRRGLIAVSVTLSILAFLSWYYITQHGRMSVRQVGHALFDPLGRKLQISDHDGNKVLTLELGLFLPADAYPMECSEHVHGDAVCIDWVKSSQENELLATMKITSGEQETSSSEMDASTILTVQVEWNSQRLKAHLEDCVLFDNSQHADGENPDSQHWYGGGLVSPIRYPMEEMEIPMQPFVSVSGNDALGGFEESDRLFGPTERLWISSSGLTINVHDDVPLQMSSNENNSQKLCFRSEVLDAPFQNPLHDFPTLLYTIFVSHNITDIPLFSTGEIFTPPTHLPSSAVFSTPIWHMDPLQNITRQTLVDFARALNQSSFQLGEIQTGLSIDFGQSRSSADVPSLQGLSEVDLKLVSQYNWTIVTSPYFGVNSDNFQTLSSEGFLIMDGGGEVPALGQWKGSYVGILDVTNREATTWFSDNLKDFRETVGLTSSFIFDGGHGADMPPNYASTIPFKDPGMFCKYYTEVADGLGRSGRRKCTHRSQESPLFIQLDPWEPNWHSDRGLRGIIPTVLQYGLLGYPFVVAPPVCGIIDSGLDVYHPVLDRELYVRWMQLLTYLPVMSFCAMPWEFDSEVTGHAREMIARHQEVAPIMKEFGLKALKTGEPIIRPIWWIAPRDEHALTMDSEYLIGDKILVAPIVEKGARMRAIYLPNGRWKDNLKGGVTDGGRWISEYQVGLWEVATFTRQS